jgi:hypothetical protein
MATAAQVDANRSNAQHSTGPATDQGKAAASQNAWRHGLRSAHPVGPGEDPAEYVAFATELVAELKPVGMAQRLLAKRIALLQWKLQRVPDAEWAELETFRQRHLRDVQRDTGKLKPVIPTATLLAGNLKRMLTLQTYELRIQRAIEQLHRQLNQLQAAARADTGKTPPPVATVKATVVESPVPTPPPQAPAKPMGEQQLETNWVRSSDSIVASADTPPGFPPAVDQAGKETAA